MRLNEEDLVFMLDMFDDFSKIMDEYNLTYFMDTGTQLGLYRHGIIPWDDDTDIFADVELYKHVRAALDIIKDKYVVAIRSKRLFNYMQLKTPTQPFVKVKQSHTHGNGHFGIYFGFNC